MRALLLLPLLLVLAACDSGRPEPSLGRFEAQIRGDIDRDLSGDAGFQMSVITDPATRALSIILIERSGRRRSISITDLGGEITGTGTYALADSRIDVVSLVYFDDRGDIEGALVPVEGTLRITAFGDDRIEGTVSARLRNITADGNAPESTLTAEFEAVELMVAAL